MVISVSSVWAVIVDVKPSVADLPIDGDAALVAELGLDSLDMMQLGRRVGRTFGVPFVIEEWVAKERAQGKELTVAALATELGTAKAG